MDGCNERFTISDIARRAGVSIRTVSRVINKHPNVKESTRAEIHRIIEECGFVPNQLARSLRRRRTNTIVMFIAHQQVRYWSQFYTRVINDITSLAHQHNFRAIISDSNPHTFEENQNDGYYLLRNGYADAAILLDAGENDRRIAFMKQLGVPFVILGKDSESETSSWVYFDNFRAGEMIGELILDRNLLPAAGFLGDQQFLASRDRVDGIVYALGSRAGEFSVIYDCLDMAKAYDAARNVLSSVRCAFVSGDERAAGIYRAAWEAGLQIPGDLSVIGFDDVPLASSLTPPLTTVRQPFERFAGDLFEALSALLLDPGDYRHIVHQPELIERGSVRPPA